EINNAASAGNKLEKAATVISGKFGQTAKEVNNSVSLLRAMVAATNKYKEGTKELNDDWKKLVQLLREAKKEAKDFEVSDQPQRSITGANIAAGLALDAIRALGSGFRDLISEGIQMEVLMIQLKGFTGSGEAAQVAFDEFLRIAAATPFNVTQVAEGARTMMGFGMSTAQATQRVEQLAIVASATGGELTHMARNLGQIQANQRAYTRDLMQFANQGIPIYQMLGDVLGMTTQQIRELAEEGSIGFAEVAAALDLMTQKGSAYRQIAEEMDRTIAARLEALQGTISATAGKFVEMFQAIDTAANGPIEKAFAIMIEAVKLIGKGFDEVKKRAELLAPLFVGIGTIISATLGIAVVQNLTAIGNAFTVLKANIMGTTIAMNALNVAKAIFAALSGNLQAIATAAAVAAAGSVSIAEHRALASSHIGFSVRL
ncbi:MAG: tape measure protein, partial [Limisphaerales bacterium]